jgi:hypothetical protein
MALPDAVQRMADSADQIEQHLAGQQNAPVAQQPTVPTNGQARDDGLEIKRLEARNKTLQGMYNADAQRYKDTITAKDRELAQLREQLNQLQNQNQESFVSEEDKENFGEDMYDFVNRAVKQASQNSGDAQLRAEVARMREELEQSRQEKQAQTVNAFYSRMDETLPDWRTQNTNPQFLEWLNEADEFSGIQRQELLNRAVNIGDASTVIGIFQHYRAVRANAQAQSPLARQVAPTHNRNTPSAGPMDTSKKIWTSAEVRDFYDAYRKGQLSEEVAQRMESEIDQAAAEGRIVG